MIVNDVWGRVVWYRNIGTRTEPRLAAAQPIEVDWEGETPRPAWNWWKPSGKELVVQWRSTVFPIDLNGDGLMDLVALDPEGYLAFYERRRAQNGSLYLLPPKRIFMTRDAKGELAPIRLNGRTGGGSGRRTFCFIDWDGDGKVDLMVNSKNAELWKNVSKDANVMEFRNMGSLDSRQLAGHNTGVTVVKWRSDGVPDLLIGAEDGHLYYLQNPRVYSQTTGLRSGTSAGQSRLQ